MYRTNYEQWSGEELRGDERDRRNGGAADDLDDRGRSEVCGEVWRDSQIDLVDAGDPWGETCE